MTTPVPCIVCDKPLEPVFTHPALKDNSQPNDATTFISHGQYGSTVWDPMNQNEVIEINVCDDCLKAKMDSVLHVAYVRRTDNIVRPWSEVFGR